MKDILKRRKPKTVAADADLKERNTELEEENGTLRAQIDQLMEEMAQLRQRHANQKKKFAALERGHKTEVEKLVQESRVVKAQLRKAKTDLEQKEDTETVTRLEERLKAADETKAKHLATIAQLRRKIKEGRRATQEETDSSQHSGEEDRAKKAKRKGNKRGVKAGKAKKVPKSKARKQMERMVRSHAVRSMTSKDCLELLLKRRWTPDEIKDLPKRIPCTSEPGKPVFLQKTFSNDRGGKFENSLKLSKLMHNTDMAKTRNQNTHQFRAIKASNGRYYMIRKDGDTLGTASRGHKTFSSLAAAENLTVTKSYEFHFQQHSYGRYRGLAPSMTVVTFYFAKDSVEANEYGEVAAVMLLPKKEWPANYFSVHEPGCKCKEKEEREKAEYDEKEAEMKRLEEQIRRDEEEEWETSSETGDVLTEEELPSDN